MQRAYLELAKYIFIPFLYGFDLNSVVNCKNYEKACEHLKKVKDNQIEAPSDISDIVKAVFDLAGTLNISDISNSYYIHKRVDQFVMLSKAYSEEMVLKKNEAYRDLRLFKRKRDFVTRDPEIDDYLQTFMSVIMNGYETSIAVNKGIYKLSTVSGETKFMQSGQSCENLIYVCGLPLRKRSSKRFISNYVCKKIDKNSKNAADTFYNDDVEEMVEFAAVSFLFKYKRYVRLMLDDEKIRLEQRVYEAYTKVVSEIIRRYVNPELQEEAGYITPRDNYASSAQILGFRDGLELFNRLIATGKLDKKKKKKLTRDEKIKELIKFLKHLNEVGGNGNKTIKIKPFCTCKKFCKACLIWNALACYNCGKAYVSRVVENYAMARCTIF